MKEVKYTTAELDVDDIDCGSNSFMKNLNGIIRFVLFFSMAVALINNSAMLMNFTVIITLGYCFFASLENNFYILCGVSLFENVFKLDGNIAWFAILIIFVIKLFLRNNFYINVSALLACGVTLCLELMLDFSIESKGQLLVNLVLVVFVFVAFSKIELLKLDALSVVWTLLASFIAVIYYLLSMYGGINEFLNSFMLSTYAFRFGHSFGDTVGGAMAIPLYTTMIIACAITCYIKMPKLSLTQKVLLAISIFVSVLFGAMTVSRSFYLGVLIILVSLLFFKNSESKQGKYLIFALLFISLMFIAFSESEFVSKIFSNLQLRLDNGVETGSGGRTDIWISCIGYLLKNPLNMIFGMGATNYIDIGVAKGELFSAGAHNLLLDFFMSWGIAGACLTISFLIFIFKKQKNSNHVFSSQTLIPLMAYVFFAMTALRTCSLKTWMFLLIAYVFLNNSIFDNERKVL